MNVVVDCLRKLSELRGVLPKCVAIDFLKLCEKCDRLPGRCAVWKDAGIAGDSNEARFRCWGCRPTLHVRVQEPLGGRYVMHMAWPGQRDENVHVQQEGHLSSSASRTISEVTGSASTLSGNVGKGDFEPVDGSPVGRSPLKANSETADPNEIPFSCARARAEASTRSSISNVVRMRASSHQGGNYRMMNIYCVEQNI